MCAISKNNQVFVGKCYSLEFENSRATARNELRLMQLCKHPNVVRLVEFFQNDEAACIVMPKFLAVDLYDYLAENWDQLPRFVLDVSAGLQYLHGMHVVHRDLNPSNIFVSEGGAFVIGDLGSSVLCYRNNAGRYQTSTMVGATPYKAPEMLNAVYGAEVDLWNFGLMLHELLRGELPFYYQNEAEFVGILRHFRYAAGQRENVFDDLIACLLSSDIDKRRECFLIVSKLM